MPTTWITICDTCKRPGWETTGMERTDGEALAALIEAEVAGDPAVRTRRVSCTMGCERACNVIVQGEGRIGYSLGTFEPGPEAADAIAAYARMHAASETGRVPFREWPQGVKGHFVSRHLPVPAEPVLPDPGPSGAGPEPAPGEPAATGPAPGPESTDPAPAGPSVTGPAATEQGPADPAPATPRPGREP